MLSILPAKRIHEYTEAYYDLRKRKGVTLKDAEKRVLSQMSSVP
jgi:phosphotransacetylase